MTMSTCSGWMHYLGAVDVRRQTAVTGVAAARKAGRPSLTNAVQPAEGHLHGAAIGRILCHC